MDESIKKILLKQLELLQQKAENANTDQLIAMSAAMAAIAQALMVGSQSFYGGGTCHPYVVQLPVEDLIALYAARARRCGSEIVAQRM